MLKGIPSILSPELLLTLMSMGHGDEICLGDANFPHSSINTRVIRCDGHGIPELLESILQLMPLDFYDPHPVMLMETVPGDQVETPIWNVYHSILMKFDKDAASNILQIERFSFYDRVKKAYAVVATGEKSLYGNIILKKGIIV